MKITKRMLKQLVKEEMGGVLDESFEAGFAKGTARRALALLKKAEGILMQVAKDGDKSKLVGLAKELWSRAAQAGGG